VSDRIIIANTGSAIVKKNAGQQTMPLGGSHAGVSDVMGSGAQAPSPRKSEKHMPGKRKNNNKTAGPPLTCAHCGANKIAHSRPQGLDNLYMRLLPRSPYRCMRCYSRFWLSEGWFDNSKRVWTLSLIALSVVGLVGYFTLGGFNDRDSQLASSSSSLDGADNRGSTNSSADSQRSEFDDPLREAARQAALEDQQALASIQSISVKTEMNSKPSTDQDAPSPQTAKLNSQTKVEVSYLIEQWRNAWEAGVSDVYLSYYSDQFTPSYGQSLARWQEQRRLRVVPSKNIELALKDVEVSFDPNTQTSTVTFAQIYTSGDYSEQSRKQLVLLKDKGAWKIMSETEIN